MEDILSDLSLVQPGLGNLIMQHKGLRVALGRLQVSTLPSATALLCPAALLYGKMARCYTCTARCLFAVQVLLGGIYNVYAWYYHVAKSMKPSVRR